MAKYIVEVPEVYIQKIEIEASSPEEALDEVYDGKGTNLGESEFNYCLDKEKASVVQIKN